tara:strand:- start:441 stop:785 length:345 start_codon:yes stop_codon:yes gene_type:complete
LNYLICLVNRFMALQPGGYTDKPEDDNTPKAHPAFNRGKIQGILETLALLRNVIVGTDNGSGTNNNPELEKIRQSIFIMRSTLDHAQDKSTYLSKQCKEALEKATEIANTLRFQ